MKDFDTKCEKIYRNRRQLNKYPFTDVVSFIFKNFKNRKNLNIIEVGCGMGNNLEFLAKFNHNIYGIESISRTIKYAKTYFQNFKNNSDFKISSFTNLPCKKIFFDLIINLAAIANVEFNKTFIDVKVPTFIMSKICYHLEKFYNNIYNQVRKIGFYNRDKCYDKKFIKAPVSLRKLKNYYKYYYKKITNKLKNLSNSIEIVDQKESQLFNIFKTMKT